MSCLSDAYLLGMCIVLCFYDLWLDLENFIRAIKRMKWLFLSIFIIYAFGTPGEYVQELPINIAPTIEGCVLGLLQITRLLIAVTTLSILFSTSTKAQLMSGLYILLLPLNLLGFNTNRFTARLLLTLDYVEELAVKEKFKFSFNQLDNMLATTELFEKDKVIVLENHPLKWTDTMIVIILIVSTVTLFYLKEFNLKTLF